MAETAPIDQKDLKLKLPADNAVATKTETEEIDPGLLEEIHGLGARLADEPARRIARSIRSREVPEQRMRRIEAQRIEQVKAEIASLEKELLRMEPRIIDLNTAARQLRRGGNPKQLKEVEDTLSVEALRFRHIEDKIIHLRADMPKSNEGILGKLLKDDWQAKK